MSLPKHYILLAIMLLFSILSFSQKSYLFELSPNELQGGTIINPAHLMKTGGDEFAIAPFSNLFFDIHLPYKFNDVFSLADNGANYLLDFKKVAQNTGPNKYFLSRSSFDWIHFSGKTEQAVWRFAIEEKFVGATGFHNNFIQMINHGNLKFLGQEYDLGLSVGEMHVRSINFSWSQAINEKINAGITAKFYSGRSWFTLQSAVFLYTQEKLEYIDMGMSGEGKTSIPILLSQITNNEDPNFKYMNYLFGFRNPGLGFDIGIDYKISDELNLSASINDLGFIYWNRNTTAFTADGEYRWNGIDISGPMNLETFKNLRQSNSLVSFRDTFLNNLIVPSDAPFYTNSPISFNIGANYIFDERISVASSLEAYFFSYYNKINFSVAGIFTPGKKFSILGGLAFSNYSLLNIPLGISYNGKYLNASIAAYNTIGLLLPQATKHFGGNINLSLVFNQIKKEKTYTTKEMPFYIKKKKAL